MQLLCLGNLLALELLPFLQNKQSARNAATVRQTPQTRQIIAYLTHIAKQRVLLS